MMLYMKRRLLVVDDEEMLLRTCACFAEQILPDWEVVTVRCGREALRCCHGDSYDTVVTDMGLPGISGRELFERIRDLSMARGIRVPAFLFVSGVRWALDSVTPFVGGIRYRSLLKPFTVQQFVEALSELCADADVNRLFAGPKPRTRATLHGATT